MLRIGLTGNLGSGKSTVAALFAAHGAHILSSDAIGRDLMQPGQPVFDAIRAHFGPSILLPNGTLDRPALARIAFAEGDAEALNAIVHPAVIARQAQLINEIATREPHAIVLIESALIFESRFTQTGPPRFDRILLVTAPKPEKIARFVQRQNPSATPAERSALEAEARRRLALQLPDEVKAPRCDYILTNDGPLARLEPQVDALWPTLQAASLSRRKDQSLQ